MKKILFSLIALVCSMSMNAQVMKVMKGGEVVETYKGADYKVVFEEEPSYLLPGSFSVSADKKVKFTKSNLYWDGSAFHFEAKPTDYPTTRVATGTNIHVGHFFWTKTAAASYAASYDGTGETTSDKFFADGSDDSHKITADGISGLYVLSAEEWSFLLDKRSNNESLKKTGVTVTDGTTSYTNCLVIAPDGFTGTIESSYTLEALETAGLVCLPAAGQFTGSRFMNVGSGGYYWSSSPRADYAYSAQYLSFDSRRARVSSDGRLYGFFLRVVLAEKPTITGSAAVKGGGTVNWVQLWAGGPKFADRNVGASSVTEKGNTMTFRDATKTGDEYAWGSLWCTPSKDDMNELLLAATSNGSDKVSCAYTQENSVWGFKFTGKTTGYASNSVFFPVQGGKSSEGYERYWSGTANVYYNAWYMKLDIDDGNWYSDWYSDDQDKDYLVRPVLKN